MGEEPDYEVIPELEQLLELQQKERAEKDRLRVAIREYHKRGLSYRTIAKGLGIDKSKVLRLAQST